MDAARALRMPSECPRCHGALISGFLLAPRGLFWDQRARWSTLLSETIVSQWSSFKMPRLSGLRCSACGLILFRGPQPPAEAGRADRAPGVRYACPGCAGDVYSSETVCPACGHPLTPPQEKIG